MIICVPCTQAGSPVTAPSNRAMWHAQCPGEFGAYGGQPGRRCECPDPVHAKAKMVER